ncbi:MAG: hypothetical protein ACT4NV_03875 [Rhodoferax sp.]
MREDEHLVPHQGAGLLALARQHAARLLPVVCLGDEPLELSLLWRLASVLSDAGYPVTVLDGTSTEAAHNPGLVHMLDHEYWPQASLHDGLGWTLLSARQGLERLDEARDGTALQALSELFVADAAVLLFAPAPLLARLLQGSPARPLVCASGHKGSLLSSYLALKQLHLHGALRPALVQLLDGAGVAGASGAVAQRVRACALEHLGLEVQTLEIDLAPGAGASSQPAPGLLRLALCMLESAAPLQPVLHGAVNARESAMGIIARGH